MLPAKHIAHLIGSPSFVERVNSDDDLMLHSEKGLKSSSVKRLAKNALFAEQEIQHLLCIPDRTFGRRKEAGYLNKQESDRLIMLAQAFASAIEVLGSAEKAKDWLLSDNQALGGRQPLSMLSSYLGSMKVMEIINRIKFGIYS